MKHDLKIASSGSLAQLVGVFTLGREKVIPNMFKYILQSLNDDKKIKYLKAYLGKTYSLLMVKDMGHYLYLFLITFAIILHLMCDSIQFSNHISRVETKGLG